MKRAARWTTAARLRSCFVSLVAVLVVVLGCFRPPAALRDLGAARVTAARAGAGARPTLGVKPVELGRAPGAKLSRGEPPRPARAESSVDVLATWSGPTHHVYGLPSAFELAPKPACAWSPPSKTHAELMVFLN